MFLTRKAVAVAIGAGLLLTGCSNASADTHPAWMQVNSTSKTVNLTIKGGLNRTNGYQNFNGYANGRMTISIPKGYTVHVKFVNVGGIPMDIGVYKSTNQQLAFRNAGDSLSYMKTHAAAGVAPGHSKEFKFVADKVGTFKMANLLNSLPVSPRNAHHGTGDYDLFKVVTGGKPSVQYS